MYPHSYLDMQKLLRKYASCKLSPDELAELKKAVNCSTDEDLEKLMRKEWEQFADMRPIDASLKEKMFTVIEKQTKQGFWEKWQKKGLQIAASVAIITLLGVSGYLYTDNYKMTELGGRDIVVTVGKGERVSITLPDGTSVRLNSESQLSYQQHFGIKERRVCLTGEGYFDVTKQPEKPFTVNTHFLDIQVLGTAFNVYTYEDMDSVEMTLVRGSVKVSTVHPPYQTLKVSPDEKVIYNKKTGEMHLKSSANQIETAWISHELVFRSATLKEVLSRVGRKYGFLFNIDDTILLDDLYTGVFDESEITDVMEILKLHFNFEYRMQENTIWISPINK